MKKSFLPSAFAAVIFATCLAWACFAGSRASAQQPPMGSAMPPAPGRIALVDVSLIIRKDVRLKGQLTELAKSMDAIMKQFEDQAHKVQDLEATLRGMTPGTQGYQKTEETVVSEKANINAQVSLKRKEYVQQQARLYSAAYKEIQKDVTTYCQYHGFSLALSFSRDEAHDDNPDEVVHSLSRTVVFFDNSMDITPYILPRYAPDQPQGADIRNQPQGVYPNR